MLHTDSESLRKAVALYNFTGRSDNELSFNKGDTLLVSEIATTDPEKWWYGMNSDGSRRGYIPVTYVEIQKGLSVCQQSQVHIQVTIINIHNYYVLHVHVHRHMRVHSHAHTHTHTHTQTHTHTYTRRDAYAHAHTHTHIKTVTMHENY